MTKTDSEPTKEEYESQIEDYFDYPDTDDAVLNYIYARNNIKYTRTKIRANTRTKTKGYTKSNKRGKYESKS